MVCKYYGCEDLKLGGFEYCEKHSCSAFKKNGERCKKRKFKRKKFCFIHSKFLGGRVGILGLILGVVGLILGIYALPEVYWSIHGNLLIDFKERKSEIRWEAGVPYVVIEVLNKFGEPLIDVNGTVKLQCEYMGREINSSVFKLPKGGKFLNNEAKEFLISHDELFIDIINGTEGDCPDAAWVMGIYKKRNLSHGEIFAVSSFDSSKWVHTPQLCCDSVTHLEVKKYPGARSGWDFLFL